MNLSSVKNILSIFAIRLNIMSWEEIKKVGYLNIQNQLYSISHLQDKKYFFQIEDNGNHEALFFELLVQYSSYCISTGQRTTCPWFIKH